MYSNHRQLIVWQKAITLTQLIYDITNDFPQHEKYGLASQMQRAAVSIPSNIAEGHGRDSYAELDRFLRIANGSALELDTQVEIAFRNEYIDESTKYSLMQYIQEISRLIHALRKQLKPLKG
ncbi:MAG: four helix bundle protein [Bacteroidales bacterium]|nr:four helix bundle protein [Bacteroidales bacterium]MCD8394189.1 four helix bundle protein [Bacteroidales bacterium]